jgi:hypothetical protein
MDLKLYIKKWRVKMKYDMKRWYEGVTTRAGKDWSYNPYSKGSWESINWKFGYLAYT